MDISTISDKVLLTMLVIGPWGAPVKPVGPSFNNPVEGISSVMVFGIRMAFVVGMVLVLIYLLWGTFDWITGGGEQEKLEKARQKLTNAVLGIVIMVAALGLFTVVSGDILGIIKRDSSGGWTFSIPSIGTCIPSGGTCNVAAGNCCASLNCLTNPLPPGPVGTCQ